MKVGINIKDQNGELKEMDTILDEMAEKWDTLSKDQQLALAQTIAGARQYTQLVALMDNWDFMEENLAVAKNAAGTLQEQADIYAESWEAASNRVTAAAEDVYSSLINEDFFISLDNGIAGLLERVDDVVDAMGGFKGILATVFTLMTSVYGDKMAQGIRNVAYNVSYLMGIEQARAVQQKKAFASQLEQASVDLQSTGLAATVNAYTQQAEVQIKMNDAAQQLTTFQKEQLQQEIQLLNVTTQRVARYGDLVERAREEVETLKDTVRQEATLPTDGDQVDEISKRYDEQHGSQAAYWLFQNAGENLGEFSSGNGNLERLINNYDVLRGRISQTSAAYRDYTETYKRLEEAQTKSRNLESADIKTTKAQQDEIDKLTERCDALEQELRGLGTSTKDASKNMSDWGETTDAIRTILIDFCGLTDEGVNALNALGNAARSAGANTAQMNASAQIQERTATSLKERIEELTKSTGDWADQLIQLVNFAGQFSMAWNAIQNLGNVFSDEDMSAAERFTSILTSVSTLIPVITNAYKFLTQTQKEGTIANTIANQVLQEQTVLEEARQKQIQESASNRIQETTTIELATAQENMNTVSLGEGVVAKAAAAVANKILATSEGEVASTARIATASIAAQIITFAPYLIAIAAAAAAIYALVKAYNADADAAKAAEEAASELADQAEETANKLTEIKNAIDQYDSAIDKLNECTKGTEEWNEALTEVNSQVNSLLSTYPELLKMGDLFNEDGTLNSEALEALENSISDTSWIAETAAIMGDVSEAEAKLKSNITNASGKYELYYEDIGHINTGYKEGSEQYYSNTVAEDLEKILDTFDGQSFELMDVYEALGSTMDDNAIITKDYAQTLLESANKTIEATIMMDNAAKGIISSWSQTYDVALETGQSEVMESTYKTTYETLKNAVKAASDENRKIYNKDYSKLGEEFLGTSYYGKSVTDAFNIARGEDYLLAGNGVRGNDEERTYAYEENGTTQEYTIKYMQETIAAAAALELMGSTAEDAAATLNTIDENLGEDVGSGIRNYLASGNFEDMTEDTYWKLASDVNVAGGATNFLAENGLDSVITAEEFKEDLNNFRTAINSVSDNATAAVREAYAELDSDIQGLTLSGKETIVDTLQQAKTYSGKAAMDMVADYIDKLDEGSLQEFVDVLSTIDWETTSAEDFASALEEAGVETNLTTDEILAFGEALSRIAPPDFDSLAETYASIHEIIDGLETGDTIEAEDYETLGDAAEGYFTKMLDGTYKLTGDAEEFYDLIQAQQIEDFQQLRQQNNDQIEKLKGVSSYDLDALSENARHLNSEGEYVYNTDTLQQQLDILQAIGGYEEEVEAWLDDFRLDDENGLAMDTQSLQDIADAIAAVNAELGEGGVAGRIDELNNAIYETDLAALSSCSSLDELKEMYAEGDYSAAAYNQALINLDKQLDTQDLDTDEWKDYAKYLQKVAKNVDNLSDELETNDEAAEIVAKSIMKMNDGIDDLADGYDDWVDVLNNSTEESEEYANAIDGMRGALANILDINGDFISNDFIANNLDLIGQAATGSAEAIDQLKAALLEDIVATIIVDNQLEDYDLLGQLDALQALIDARGPLEAGATIDDEDFINTCNEIIKNAKLTADQANALFDAMGFETTFKTESVPVERTGHETITTTTVDEWGEAEMADGSIQRYPAVMRTQTSQGEPYTYTEYVDAIAMDSTEEGSGEGSPIITGITKKATGSYNNYSSRNSGGKSLGSSSSGGGSSSDTTSEPQKKDETGLNNILDRYHEINDQLDDVTRSVNKLDTATDRLYGVKKFANMDKEIRKLQEQNDLYAEKTRQAEEYLGTIESGDMGALVDAAAGLGFTLDENSFDAEGNLLNVEEIQRSMWEKLHEMEATYNSLATGDEQDTYEEEVLQPWQDKIDEFQDALDLYEETRELIQDLAEERDEIRREIEDIRFEKLVAKVEIRLDYKDAQEDLNELAKTITQAVGTAYDWGKESAELDYDNMQLELSKYRDYKTEYQQLLDLYEESKINDAINTEDIAEQLEDLRGQIADTAEALVEWAEDLEEALPDAIDAAREHFDQFIGQLEHNTNVIDSIKELMTLQGMTLKTEQGFNDLQDIYQKRMNANLSQAKLNKAWYDEATQQLAQAETALAAATQGTEEYDILKANRDALLEEQNEAQEAMLESAQDAIEDAQEMYTNAVERAAYEMEQVLTQGTGFDLLQDKYDHYLDTEERYLDVVNRIYETTTLNNKLQQEIDKTTNSAAAAKLKALQDEFTLREANNNLSEYDIEIMNAKLDLTLKQMALEEAQNAKTELRLVRNAQGNWNYQYTANQDEITAANQEYLDAQNEYYNIAKQRVEDVTGEIISTWQEMTDKIKEIYEDESLTVDEREAAIAETREYYTQKVKDLEEDKQTAIADMTEAGQEVIEDFRDAHSAVLEDMGDDVDALEALFGEDLGKILSNTDDFNNEFATDMDQLSQEVDDIDTVFNDAIDSMESAAQDYQDAITEVNDTVGTSYDDLKEILDQISGSTEKLTEDGLYETDMMWDKLTALQNITEEYSHMADAIRDVASALKELGTQTLGTQYNSIGGLDSNIDYSALIAGGLSSGELAYGSDAYNELMSYRDFAYDERGGSESGWMDNETLDKLYQDYLNGTLSGSDADWFNKAVDYSGDYENNSKTFLEWLESLGISSLSSGGYTGDFDDGRLAILHEKELVLNQEDTQNILAATKAIEGIATGNVWDTIVTALDKSIAIAQGMMMEKLSSIFASAASNEDNSVKEAIIYAEFPNVHDARDVEEALRNLANDASQYASQFQSVAS